MTPFLGALQALLADLDRISALRAQAVARTELTAAQKVAIGVRLDQEVAVAIQRAVDAAG